MKPYEFVTKEEIETAIARRKTGQIIGRLLAERDAFREVALSNEMGYRDVRRMDESQDDYRKRIDGYRRQNVEAKARAILEKQTPEGMGDREGM